MINRKRYRNYSSVNEGLFSRKNKNGNDAAKKQFLSLWNEYGKELTDDEIYDSVIRPYGGYEKVDSIISNFLMQLQKRGEIFQNWFEDTFSNVRDKYPKDLFAKTETNESRKYRRMRKLNESISAAPLKVIDELILMGYLQFDGDIINSDDVAEAMNICNIPNRNYDEIFDEILDILYSEYNAAIYPPEELTGRGPGEYEII